jgi:hypothetical protein
MELYASLAEDTPSLTERCLLIIRIRKALLYSPCMFVDTSRALSAEGQYDVDFILTLELKIRAIHHDLLNCFDDYALDQLIGVSNGCWDGHIRDYLRMSLRLQTYTSRTLRG